MAETYHLRRLDRDMPDRADQLAVLRGQKFLSLAMARDNEPYLVSLNYAFDEANNCFYVHSAPEGKKLDFLRTNPRVWGQVVEDRGYVPGECAHAYRSVMFRATAEMVDDSEPIRAALAAMIDHADPSPEALKRKLVDHADLSKVVILRLRVQQMSGKASA